MTHENDFPPLFDDPSSDDTNAVRSIYARPDSAPEPDEPIQPSETPPQASASVDIDSALAALASLQDLAFQEEVYTDEGYAPPDDDTDSSDEDRFVAPAPATGEWAAVSAPRGGTPTWSVPLTDASRPTLLTLERGQATSIVPALLLIGGGAWGLLLALTGSAFPVAQLPAMIMASVGVILLVLWVSLGRRSDGSLFGSLVLLALSIVSGVLTQTESWSQNYPMLAVALGAACLVGSVGIKAYRRWLLLFGIALILGGIGLVTAMSQSMMPQIIALVPVVIILAIVLPLILRVLVPTLPTRPVSAPSSTYMVEPEPDSEPVLTEESSS